MNRPEIDSGKFDDLVALPYRLYNSLFLTLPFSNLSTYGAELPLFAQRCRERLEKGDDPSEVVEEFLSKTLGVDEEETQHEILFLFQQLVERQVLLFDAVEQAAAEELVGRATEQIVEELKEKLPPAKAIRVVLTAHPTQFYPEVLLGLIQDISWAVQDHDVGLLRKLLLQLGRTSFRNPHPPTPLEEAEMLIDQFGEVFHEVFTDLAVELGDEAPRLELGFWPGGDRDGNPSVTAEITGKVCDRLRGFARHCLLEHVERLRRRITFKGVTHELLKVRQRLQNDEYEDAGQLEKDLRAILQQVDADHNGLFREEVVRALKGLALFGFHFASLDLRQSSDVIGSVLNSLHEGYADRSEEEKIQWLSSTEPPKEIDDDLVKVLQLVPAVQKKNGPLGMHRIIVSHTEQVLHLLEIFYLSRWYAEGKLDIVPLFESIDDMLAAPGIMEDLFSHKPYREHLRTRGNRQTVMLGFSDGTKDGGYVTCNWEIQQCKQKLNQLAASHELEIVYFDGRGGPPARGGGSTHKYYASVAEKIPLDQIQLTVQGQSISSYYGSYEAGKYNLSELLAVFQEKRQEAPDNLLKELAERAHHYYQELREDPKFIPLLMETTPLPLLGELNIASRPPKRSADKAPSVENLRAISFVGAWSLMKINVPAFYGFGLALEEMIQDGRLEELQAFYRQSMFFRVLIGNSAQAIRKSYLPLTRYTESDPDFGQLWKRLRSELERTKECLLQVTGQKELKLDNPISERSVALREEIVLPLLVIQHYALKRWRENRDNPVWKKLLLKSIPPSINASRNSA